MTLPRSPRALARASAGVALVLALASCTAPTPAPTPTASDPTAALASARATACGGVAQAVVDTLQAYVDSFAGLEAAQLPGAATTRATSLEQEATRLRADAVAKGCSGAGFVELVRAELGRLRGATPVQEAVAATFRADPLGTLDPSDAGAREVDVTTAAQLVEAVAKAGAGSVIRLAAGTYRLEAPLVLLRPVTLQGAGREATTVTSPAAGATLVLATTGDARVTGLTLAHTGERAASVALVAGGGYDFSGVGFTGARSSSGAGGFGLVLRPGDNALEAAAPVRRLADVAASDNAGGGIVVAGREAPTITGASVTGTPGCAVCYVEDATGSLTGLTVSDAGVAVRIDQRAAPRLAGVRSTGAEVGLALSGSGTVSVTDAEFTGGAIGVQATGSGEVRLSATQVRDSREVGVRLSGTTRAGFEAFTATGVIPVGVAVVAQARAEFAGGAVTTTGDAGVVLGDGAGVVLARTAVTGARLGVQAGGTASLEVTDATATGRDAAVLAGGTTTGSLRALRCDGGRVLLREATKLTVASSPTCKVARG